MNDETPLPDLPPGLTKAQVARVRIAAGACHAAIGASNYPIGADILADLLMSVCKAYETGVAEWRADGLDQVLVARDALKQVSDAARVTENTEVLDAARIVITALNDLYVEVDTALRAIDGEAIEQAWALVASRQTAAIAREDAGRVPGQIGKDVAKVEQTLQQTQVTINNITKHSEYSVIKIEMGDVSILFDRVKATLAHINISFRMEKLFDGIISFSADGLETALAAMKQAAEAVRDAAAKTGDLAGAVTEMLAPLGKVVKDGAKLVARVRKAVEKLFGPGEPLPWPTGLRLLPPVGTGDEPRDVELIELRRFEGVVAITFGLAPLPGGRFVSGGTDSTLRLWSATNPAPLAEMAGHEGDINSIAALDRDRVVTASDDKTLILWDLAAQKLLRRFRGHAGEVMDVAALGPDRFVSVALENDCRLWHARSGEAARVWEFDVPNGIAALRPSLFVTGEYQIGDLQFLDLAQEAPLHRVQSEDADLWKAAAVTAETVLAVRSNSPGLRLWTLGQEAPQALLTGQTHTCQDVALLSTTRAVSVHGGALALWSLPDGALLTHVETPGLTAVRALPTRPGENPRFVVGGADGYLALWEVRPA